MGFYDDASQSFMAEGLPWDAGSLLTLQGAGAYDAAVHCASVSAARRITQHSPGGTPMPESPG
jgi:hypothetical protein